MEEGLRAILTGNPALLALVGERISWVRRPQDVTEYPDIVLTRIAGRRDLSLKGVTGLVESLVQADCFAETYTEAKAVARALRDAINGYSGTDSGTEFQRIAIDSERDTSETDTRSRHPFRVSLDLSIWHDE